VKAGYYRGLFSRTGDSKQSQSGASSAAFMLEILFQYKEGIDRGPMKEFRITHVEFQSGKTKTIRESLGTMSTC